MAHYLHKDAINWEAFCPQETKEEESRLNKISREENQCRGCGISHDIPDNQETNYRVWCLKCVHSRSRFAVKIGWERSKWLETINRPCRWCKSERPLYPLNTRCYYCSEECKTNYIKEYKKIYGKNNKERLFKLYSKRYEINRFKILCKTRKWRMDNPERSRESQRRYRIKNREGIAKAQQMRQAIRNDKTSMILFERQKGLCGLTNLPMNLDIDSIHIDHIIPIERDGTNHHMNLQLTHGVANCKKQDKLHCEIPAEDWRDFYNRSLEEMIKVREERNLPTTNLIKLQLK